MMAECRGDGNRIRASKLYDYDTSLETRIVDMVVAYYDGLRQQYKEPNDKSEITDNTADDSSSNGPFIELYATFGTLFDIDDEKKRIRIPILTEAVLDSTFEESDFHFVENCEEAKTDTVWREIVKPAQARGLTVKPSDIHLFEQISSDTNMRLVRTPSGGEICVVKQVVNSCTVFRGKLLMHMQFCLIETSVIDSSSMDSQTIGREESSIIHAYDFQQNNRAPNIRLLVIERKGKSETPDVILHLNVCIMQLLSQLERRYRGEPNGVKKIINELVSNARRIASIFDTCDEGSDELYFPNYFGDIASQSRTHYNLKQQSQKTQKESGLEFLRKCNNEVKRMVIQEHVPQNGEILDLACGHGQDLQKYSNKNVKKMVGVDISPEEIKEAKRRSLEQKMKNTLRYSCSFHVQNIQSTDCWEFIDMHTKFDVVSIQLAIHYCLQSERAATLLLQRISNCLKEGGLFIGSTVDSDELGRRLVTSTEWNKRARISNEPDQQTYTYTFGNAIHTLKMSEDVMRVVGGDICLQQPDDPDDDGWPMPPLEQVQQRLGNIWGLQYHYSLLAHIEAPEFVVPWIAFEALALRCGLQKVMSINFMTYLKKTEGEAGGISRILEKFVGQRDALRPQFEVISFYKAFVFRKPSSSSSSSISMPMKDNTNTNTVAYNLSPLAVQTHPITSCNSVEPVINLSSPPPCHIPTFQLAQTTPPLELAIPVQNDSPVRLTEEVIREVQMSYTETAAGTPPVVSQPIQESDASSSSLEGTNTSSSSLVTESSSSSEDSPVTDLRG